MGSVDGRDESDSLKAEELCSLRGCEAAEDYRKYFRCQRESLRFERGNILVSE